MAFSLKKYVFGRKVFCCCVPVRVGVLGMTLMSILLSGTLLIGMWLKTSRSFFLNLNCAQIAFTQFRHSGGHDLTSKERSLLIVVGVVQTLLFVASVLGYVGPILLRFGSSSITSVISRFAGTVVRKLLFVRLYAYFIYGHFVLNLVVAIYFLWAATNAANDNALKACQAAVEDPQAEAQCKKVLRATIGAFFGIVFLVLLIELCAFVFPPSSVALLIIAPPRRSYRRD
jgi:hypothetical protein